MKNIRISPGQVGSMERASAQRLEGSRSRACNSVEGLIAGPGLGARVRQSLDVSLCFSLSLPFPLEINEKISSEED